jgi:hypothetical protein
MDLCTAEGVRYPIDLSDLYTKAGHLIAYIAFHRLARLDEMRTHIFGASDADADQVHNAFSTAKRDIRRRINATAERANAELGRQVFPDDLDLFSRAANKRYALSPSCRVVDLSFIEEQQKIIEGAEKSNQLLSQVPDFVRDACERLIAAYVGDFIEDLLVVDPIDPWYQSWAREPFTKYRDAYLQALLYAGEYERKAGDQMPALSRKQERYANAARLFAKGSLDACRGNVCEGRFDTKVTFAKQGRRAGPHVLLSEQMIRRAIALYGQIGTTTLANRTYSEYEQHMQRISGRTWTPQIETIKILEDALQQTGAYQFGESIASPHNQEDDHLLKQAGTA